MSEEDSKVVEAMENFGGSFVQALAAAFRRADYINFSILKNAFPNYWKEYKKFIPNKLT